LAKGPLGNRPQAFYAWWHNAEKIFFFSSSSARFNGLTPAVKNGKPVKTGYTTKTKERKDSWLAETSPKRAGLNPGGAGAKSAEAG
jgi:hypothetical protein